MFSAEELHTAFAQLLAATDGDVREVIKAALDALMARRAHLGDQGHTETVSKIDARKCRTVQRIKAGMVAAAP